MRGYAFVLTQCDKYEGEDVLMRMRCLQALRPRVYVVRCLEAVDGTEMLLDIVGSRVLPAIITESKDDGDATTGSFDTGQSSCLFRDTRACRTVTVTSLGPSTLQVVRFALAGADGVHDAELALDECTSFVSGGGVIEEGMSIESNNIDDSTEGIGVFLPGVDRLGERDKSGVASTSEGRLGRGDKYGEVGSRDETTEDSLITADDQLNKVELSPGDDSIDLGFSSIHTPCGQ